MTTHLLPSTSWRTASFSDSSNSALLETSALGEHLDVCKRCSRSLYAVQRGADLMHGFFSGRFVTTLALIALIIGLSSLAL